MGLRAEDQIFEKDDCVIMKIGILTYHRSINYGAFVQAYALQRTLIGRFGDSAEIEIIDYESSASSEQYRKLLSKKTVRYNLKILKIYRNRTTDELQYAKAQREAFRRGMREYLTLSEESLVSDDIEAFRTFVQDKYDLIIVGSDEVWKVHAWRPFPNAYWLPEIENCIKASFAASSRETYESISTDKAKLMKAYLDTFSFISVRDNVTKALIGKIAPDRDIKIMCDPTMAYDFDIDINRGKQLLRKKFGIDPNRPVVGVMDANGRISKYAVKKYSRSVQIVPLYKYVKNLANCGDIDPIEWIHIIYALDGLLTSFYHGMCMAINGNVPFRLFEYRKVKEPMQSKSYDLLSRYGRTDLYTGMNDSTAYTKAVDDFMTGLISGALKDDYRMIKKTEQKMLDQFIDYLSGTINKKG